MYRKREPRPFGRYLNDPVVNAIDRNSQDHYRLEEWIDVVARAIVDQRAPLRETCPLAGGVNAMSRTLLHYLQGTVMSPPWAKAAFEQALPLLDLEKIAKEIWPELKTARAADSV